VGVGWSVEGDGINVGVGWSVEGDGIKPNVSPSTLHPTPATFESSPSTLHPSHATQIVLDEWRDTTQWGIRSREAFRRWRRDGEVFLRFFRGGRETNGLPVVRFVEPEQVGPPPGEDADGDWSFGILTDREDVENVQAFFVRDPLGTGSEGDEVPAARILHLKANVDTSIKRGLPDFMPVQDDLERVRRMLRNMGEVAAVQTAIAWVSQYATATADQVGTLIRAGSDYTRPKLGDPSGKYMDVVNYEPGTVLHMDSNCQFVAGPVAQGTSGFIQVEQAILRGCGARWRFPEYFSGDASNNNMASSIVAGSPFVVAVEGNQLEWGVFERAVAKKVLELCVESGRLSREQVAAVDVKVIPPAVALANRGEEERLREMRNKAGVLSVTTWQQQVGLDPKHEAANFEAEASKKGGEGGRSVGESQENCEGEEEISEGMLKGKRFTGEIRDSLGRRRCYRDGKQIPCERGVSIGASADQPPATNPDDARKQAEAEKKDLKKQLPPVVDEVLRHILSDANTNYAVWKWWSKRSEQEKDAVIAQLDQLSRDVRKKLIKDGRYTPPEIQSLVHQAAAIYLKEQALDWLELASSSEKKDYRESFVKNFANQWNQVVGKLARKGPKVQQSPEEPGSENSASKAEIEKANEEFKRALEDSVMTNRNFLPWVDPAFKLIIVDIVKLYGLKDPVEYEAKVMAALYQWAIGNISDLKFDRNTEFGQAIINEVERPYLYARDTLGVDDSTAGQYALYMTLTGGQLDALAREASGGESLQPGEVGRKLSPSERAKKILMFAALLGVIIVSKKKKGGGKTEEIPPPSQVLKKVEQAAAKKGLPAIAPKIHIGAAAKGYPGIKITPNGFGPDFAGTSYLKTDLAPGQKNIVNIKLKGNRYEDFKEANRLAGFKGAEPPEGYTWHHVANYDHATGEATMQLVEKGAHRATYPHKGSVHQYEQATGKTYK